MAAKEEWKLLHNHSRPISPSGENPKYAPINCGMPPGRSVLQANWEIGERTDAKRATSTRGHQGNQIPEQALSFEEKAT